MYTKYYEDTVGKRIINYTRNIFFSKSILLSCSNQMHDNLKLVLKWSHKRFSVNSEVQSNLVIRNILVTLKLILNAKCSLSLWSKLSIGHGKWFLNANLFLIKPFLITKFDYRMRAIITRGLYTFYPIFEGQKRFFKELFL
jgi:hypothetical protein